MLSYGIPASASAFWPASLAQSARTERRQPGPAVALEHRQPALHALVDDQLDPAPRALQRDRIRRHAHQAADDLEIQVALGPEVVVQQAAGHTGLGCDLRGR